LPNIRCTFNGAPDIYTGKEYAMVQQDKKGAEVKEWPFTRDVTGIPQQLFSVNLTE